MPKVQNSAFLPAARSLAPRWVIAVLLLIITPAVLSGDGS